MNSLPSEPDTTTTANARPLCSICNHKFSIYTCPRCSTRTCSLPCSTKHKTNAGCTGERNKAAYVPMNKYGWGTMMNDFVFLEDLGRKVSDWGKEIVKGGLDHGANPGGRGRGRGGMARGGPSRTKRDILKIQLDIRDIDMELLPNGMEKRKLNQSIWDFKKQTAFLTIEFKVHPPRDPAAPSAQPLDPPIKLLTHRNSIDTPILPLLQAYATQRSKSKHPCPAWVSTLLFPDPDDPDSFHPPEFVMRAQMDPEYLARNRGNVEAGYYKLEHSEPLLNALRGTHFVEFPIVEVWEKFHGTIVTPEGDVTKGEGESRPKRRRVNARAGKKAMDSLLGGYGSESDNDVDGPAQNLLNALGGYDGSEDEGAQLEVDGEIDEGMDIDAAAVLELIKQARRENSTRTDSDDDNVDWGDSDDEAEI
ncbi:hypothetical protein PLEOSDRAFT_50176 [Pleurotus ostreatus PC15]|uniref:HIT-type domain-containing protein n=1 Tax=Pleurotus ostreatus (strain PC15) TaxID=1137138 RepID=A0A067NLW5_PLEO1|nr:hypothetical protein PLEOSDRAFT_50176 [Pleurotus ostreatus PC15]